MASSFTHLHVHTEYSPLDGAAKLKPLAARAAELGQPALGMTDHGNMFGAYDFHRTVTAAGLKPILGCEAYIAPVSRHHKRPVFWGAGGQRDAEGEDVSGGGAYLHMTMLAETPQGLRNLFWLTSKASMEGQYKKPRMDKEIIAERAAGIIATTGCPGGEISTRLALGQYDEALKAAAEWQDILGKDNYFLEVMDHGVPIERKVRDDLLRLGKALSLPPLATNDSHYVMPGDADTHDNLLCIGVGKTKADEKRFKFAGEGYYLKTAQEMRALWDGQVPGACDNTLLIAERVQSYAEVFAPRDLMPRFDVPGGHTQETWLREETMTGLRARYGDPLGADVVARAEYELGVIEQTGFAAYFLVCADITRHARKIGVTVGPGRGSAAGSLVAYALRITDLDPLAHGLMFERFLNPDRVTMPDADLDFDERRRPDVIRYVTEKYGAEHCSLILTFSTMKAKAAVKDAARVLGYPYAVGERITKAFPAATQGNEIPLGALFDAQHPRHKEAAPLLELYRSDHEAKAVIDAARGLEGITRGTGVHPAGVILSAVPLIDVVPLMKREADGAIICGWPYQQAEELGLLKMDFLGLRNLTIMADALDNIRRRLGVTVDLDNLPLDDAKTYQLLARGDTLGVFQLDGTGIRALLRMMKPTRFADISAVGALYRPGPMGADSHTNYALRKNGAQPITPIHPDLAEPLADILGETYGLIVYQEQVMAIAQKVAGFSLGKADLLRRAMGKKKKAELDKQFASFEQGMKERGFSAQAVRTLWDILLPFSDYAFNKAHSAAYGMVSYWTAYLKANYPADYMAALLTSVGDNKDRMAVYLSECRHLGIKVLPPDVNSSALTFTAVSDGEVRFGLGAVRNVGEGAAEAVVQGRRGGPYASFGDYLARVPSAACTKRVTESLIKAGAFDALGHPRQGLLLAHAPAVERASEMRKHADVGQDDLFGDVEEMDEVAVPGVEWDKKTSLGFEREMLGLYVSDHPLSAAEETLRRHRTVTVAGVLEEGREGQQVTVCGMLARVEHRTSKSGNPWGLLAVEDLDGQVEAVVFGKTYELYREVLVQEAVVAVEGQVQQRDGGVSIIVSGCRRVETGDAAVTLTVRAGDLTPPTVRRIKRILRENPGSRPFRIAVREGSRTTVLAVPYQVDADARGFASEFKQMFGVDAFSP